MDADDPHPTHFGRYEVLRLVGTGAMGRVYEARDPAVGRLVAVKTIRPEHLQRPDAPALVERFQREARAAGTLSHPGIVGIYDVGENFLVMELVEGVDLARLLARHGPLDIPAAIALFTQVADAIDTAHANGVVHRDLKPSNIMVQGDGRPKLMDFGVARLESGASTKTGEVLGSPSYMSPEQIAGEVVDGRADIFSLGVVIYEALTGQRPFQGDTITNVIYRVINEAAPSPRTWREDLPAALDAVFERALSKKPAGRFSTGRELVTAIVNAVPGAVAPEVRSSPPPKSRGAGEAPGSYAHHEATLTLGGTTHRRPAVSAAVLGGLALLAVVAVALWPWSPGRAGPALPPDRPTAAAEPAGTVDRYELMIETQPRGASAEIDGAVVGETPIAAEVEPGVHELRLTRAGHAPIGLRFEVRQGEPPEPLFFELAPVVARLEITSEPAGADVFVDAEKVGVTPFEGGVLPGRLEILVNRPGVGAWRRTVTAAAGERLEFHAVLRAASAIGPGADGIWEVGAGVTAPERISGLPAPYPVAALRADLEGSVTVEMIVTESGRPRDLVVTGSGGPVLDEAVLAAVAEWRFEPARRDGEPVRVRWRVRQEFRLSR